MTDLDSTTGGIDPLLSDSARRLFAGTCTFDGVQAAEADGWAPTVWQAVADAGFAWIGIPTEAGGSGGSLADGCEVLRIAGANAAPIPLAETGMLGGWLLARGGVNLPDGPVTVVPGASGDSVSATVADDGAVALTGVANRVPWAARAERIVALVATGAGHHIVSIDPAATTIEHATNVAGEPRETVHLDGVVVPGEHAAPAPDDLTPELFRLRGALSRVMLMAGALEAMSALTIGYTCDRKQFGRPIGRFQAVQQHLVWGAQDAALTTMAAQLAARDGCNDLAAAAFQVAAAKTLADDCAASATRWAHQAHGAMGMTREYRLHHLSRRLWSWRREYARPGEWAAVVGRRAEAAGADGLYPLITS